MALFAGVLAVAVVMTDILGFLGLLLIGAATWLICVRAAMNDDLPTWGQRSFAARMMPGRSPEEREARHAERQAFLGPLRFFSRCGMVLTAIGAAGMAWQYWLAATSNGH